MNPDIIIQSTVSPLPSTPIPRSGSSPISFQILIQVALGFIATLIATLIGVEKGFEKDREAKNSDEKRRVLNHIRSVRNELNANKSAAESNYRLLRSMQSSDGLDSDHYSVMLLSTESWGAAVDGRINQEIDEDLYSEIQELYSDFQYINELIRRVRTEPLHQRIGDSESIGELELEVWSITVTHWNDEAGEPDVSMLGDLIKNECNQANIKAKNISNRLDNEIEKLSD